MKLMFTYEGSITQLVSTKDDSAIDRPSTKQGRVIGAVCDDSNEVNEHGIIESNSIKTSKSVKSKELVQLKKTRASFLISESKLVFTQLRQVFIKVPILYYFDPECHIKIETNVSGYTIGGVLSQLSAEGLDQWHLVALYS